MGLGLDLGLGLGLVRAFDVEIDIEIGYGVWASVFKGSDVIGSCCFFLSVCKFLVGNNRMSVS